jgi:hypothetical protein
MIINRIFMGALILAAASLPLSKPAFAQFDLSGQWSDRYHEDWPERIPGPDTMDLTGLPLSDAGRAKADSWNVSVQTLPERQCIPHPAPYGLQGPANLHIWSETNPSSGRPLAWYIYGTFGRATLTIWMDGRPHPSPNALHTYEGFTTGEWEGDTLTTYTTHIKMGYLRRNGVPTSDRTTVISHFVRHDDILTVTTIVEDPVYLTEPFIRSHSWVLDPSQQVLPTPCEPVVEVARPKGAVPHFLPGENPFIGEVTKLYGIPLVAVRGGPETMYPEFRKKIKDQYVAPEKCERYCCGWGGGGTGNVGLLKGCITGGAAGQ